jgi:hypothetical protein
MGPRQLPSGVYLLKADAHSSADRGRKLIRFGFQIDDWVGICGFLETVRTPILASYSLGLPFVLLHPNYAFGIR